MVWGMRSNDVTANGLADVVGLPMLSSQCNHNTKHGQEPTTRPHHSAGKRDRDPYPLPCKMLEGRRRRPRALY